MQLEQMDIRGTDSSEQVHVDIGRTNPIPLPMEGHRLCGTSELRAKRLLYKLSSTVDLAAIWGVASTADPHCGCVNWQDGQSGVVMDMQLV